MLQVKSMHIKIKILVPEDVNDFISLIYVFSAAFEKKESNIPEPTPYSYEMIATHFT